MEHDSISAGMAVTIAQGLHWSMLPGGDQLCGQQEACGHSIHLLDWSEHERWQNELVLDQCCVTATQHSGLVPESPKQVTLLHFW